jgi:hypothetical protein
MVRYNQNSSCAKCGFSKVSSEYKTDSDCIKRECGRCGYYWSEKSLTSPFPDDEEQPEAFMPRQMNNTS